MFRIVIAVLCLLVAATAAARSIQLGPTQVWLGADKSTALASASVGLEVVPGLSGYTLFRDVPGERLGPPVGSLHFAGGRLVRVERMLGVLHGRAVAQTLKRMIAAFRSATEGAGAGTIETSRSVTKSGVNSRVVFNLPDRQIVISLYQPNDADVPATAEVSAHFSLRSR